MFFLLCLFVTFGCLCECGVCVGGFEWVWVWYNKCLGLVFGFVAVIWVLFVGWVLCLVWVWVWWLLCGFDCLRFSLSVSLF